jgi:hypothetical protein
MSKIVDEATARDGIDSFADAGIVRCGQAPQQHRKQVACMPTRRQGLLAILDVARQDARVLRRQGAKPGAVDHFGPCCHRNSDLLKSDGALVLGRGIGKVSSVNVQEVGDSPDRGDGVISGLGKNESNERMVGWL